MKRNVLFVALLLNANLGWSQGSEFQTYEIKYLPYKASDCPAVVSNIKTKFEAATTKKVVFYSCKETPDTGIAVSLNYQNEKPLSLNSAVFGLFWAKDSSPIFSKPLYGLYETLEACFKDLPIKSNDFEKQTGLTPIASYCDRASESNYFAQIDGFGKSKNYFFEANVEVRGGADKGITGEIASFYSSKGAAISYQIPWGSTVAIGYYGPEVFMPRLINFGISQVLEKDDCEFELQNVKNVFNDQKINGLFAAKCLADSSLDSRFYFLNFALPEEAKLKSFWVNQGFKFKSFGECLGQKQDAIAAYKAATGRNVWSGVCLRQNEFDDIYVLSFFGI